VQRCLLAIGLLLITALLALAQLRPEPDAIAPAPPELIDRLRTDAFRYLTVKRAGWLNMGIGSAVKDKILIRIQGPTAELEDDELVEAKKLRDLTGLRCLEELPTTRPALRVITGARELGRLKHNILAAGPSYRELSLDDLRSVEDLAAIVYDSGVQLGAGCIREETGSQGAERRRELASYVWLERRIRDETSRLVEQMLLGWKELGAR
jgi:hypothetical protein